MIPKSKSERPVHKFIFQFGRVGDCLVPRRADQNSFIKFKFIEVNKNNNKENKTTILVKLK